jgi:hypothetical protein
MTSRRSRSWIILLTLCLAALVEFIIRGPVLAWRLSQDFKTFYAASRASSYGMNAYDHRALDFILDHVGGAGGGHTWQEEPSICPPTTYAILSPIAQLPWPTAKLLWCLLNVTSLVVLLGCLCDLAGFTLYGLRSFMLVAGVLALQPCSAALRVGQLSLMVAALGAAALVLSRDNRQSASGVVAAFALALKPHLALAFLGPHVISRRWRPCFAALLTMLTITGIAVLRMHPQTGWFSSWASNLRSAFAATGVNSIDPTSPHHRNMINLQYPLRVIVNNGWSVNALAFGIGAILVLPVFRPLSSYPEISASTLLHSVSLLAIVQLLIVYHRDYDAVLLAFPLAWALSPQVPPARAWPAILLIAVFFVPFLHFLYKLDQWTPIRPLSSTLFWQAVVWPYQTWTLLALAAWLSYLLLPSRRGFFQLDKPGTNSRCASEDS